MLLLDLQMMYRMDESCDVQCSILQTGTEYQQSNMTIPSLFKLRLTVPESTGG